MSKRHSTRRDFNKNLALLAAAPLVASQAPPAAAAQPPDQPRPAETIVASARALTEIVRLRHGKHLTEEQLTRVRQRIENNLRSGVVLRRFPLRNADEPDFVFSAEILG
ncbi:MAG TPA: hypothetical protein VEL76_00865 [Gemmataceae bacterium]|nr:hypothetical protein [Gemmataceae bacterium]